MEWYKILVIVLCTVFVVFIFSNDKIKIGLFASGYSDLLSKYKDGKKVGTSLINIITFILFPLSVPCGIVYGFNYCFNLDVANALLTVFSIIFTILFGTIAIVSYKNKNDSKIRQDVASQTFSFTIMVLILSIFVVVLLIVYIPIIKYNNFVSLSIFTCIIIFLAIHIFLILLVIIKRIFRLYETQ